jgi:nucleotide-binding universal stress UspA family protein
MPNRPTIVCPVDFSEGSRTALDYACVLAEHFRARLLVVAVDDPLLTSAAKSAGLPSLAEETEGELRRFMTQTAPAVSTPAATIDFLVTVGKPAPEILRLAHEAASDLIVMSSQGRTGVSKQFLGSTTERVLRETTTPVLITPRDAARVSSVSEISGKLRRVIAPVDLTDASPRQVRIAGGIASVTGVPLLLAHVLESIYIPPRVRAAMPGADHERLADAEARLRTLAASSGVGDAVETLSLNGDASEEIVRLADTRGAGLIVMGLHSSGLLGPRMGSVTYRVLSRTRSLVLAVPPAMAASAAWTTAADTVATK